VGDVIEAGKEFSEVQRSLALGRKLGKVVYMEEHSKSSPYTQTFIFVPSGRKELHLMVSLRTIHILHAAKF